MRHVVWIVLAACGQDGIHSTDDAAGVVDATGTAPTDTAGEDGMIEVSPDGAPPMTLCEQAATHSDFAWIEANVLVPSCAVPQCHTGSGAVVDLRLDAGQAKASLVNRSSSTQSGWVRVVPGSVTSSYLAVALGRASGPPPRDGLMPLGADPLCVEIDQAIERWIAAGAQ